MDSVRSCLFPERREPGRPDQLEQIINTHTHTHTAIVKTGNTFSGFYFNGYYLKSIP